MSSTAASSSFPATQDANNHTAAAAVKFVPFSTSVESAFWVRYCRAKLDTIQLNEAPVPLQLTYAVSNHLSNSGGGGGGGGGGLVDSINTGSKTLSQSRTARLQCNEGSLLIGTAESDNHTTTSNSNNECVSCTGSVLGYNTLQAFQSVNKNNLLREFFTKQFFGKDDTKVLQSLTSTLLVTFCDLKNHKVVYWFGLPVLLPQHSIVAERVTTMSTHKNDTATTTTPSIPSIIGSELDDLPQHMDALRRQLLPKCLPPYFLYSRQSGTCVTLGHLAYHELSDASDLIFGFFDPSRSDTTGSIATTATTSPEVLMGWPLRNLVAYLSFHLGLGGTTVRLLSYRPHVVRRLAVDEDTVFVDPTTDRGTDRSILLSVRIPTKADYGDVSMDTADNAVASAYKVVGWELNARSKPGPRSVNLKPLLDPHHLAVQAADLNLKLMKWRMIPDLNVELLQSTKVLLIGAGTLGCNVARVLLGWGIRHFTIVDNGTVSYSNPVRQSLFTLEDCHADHGSGRSKATAAAAALTTLAPDVHARGVTLSVPMPGHTESDASLQTAVETLDDLITDADVVYLLTDTRESRWLPTVAAAAHGTLLVNAALGLDSWLVMRHGGGPREPSGSTDASSSPPTSPPPRHGCYFCSDVVAPENSTRNRTLDQQCTVTRPGLALIASAMAVELMVSILHHPLHLDAPAPVGQSTNYAPTVASSSDSSPLGVIPHQVRGSLVSYTMMTPTVPAFECCTGCSRGVVEAYRKDKVGLVQKTCQTVDGSYLEDIAGLTSFRAEAAEKMVEMDGWDDDEDEEE